MHPVNTLDLARERQADLRRQARAARAARGPASRSADVGAVRHSVAHTLRRLADQLEPASLGSSEERLRLIR